MSERILAIDDDLISLRLIKRALELDGYQVMVATNGKEGLQKFYAEQPHLVVLDLIMPEMDGWEVCRRIRSVSTVPIIILTARGLEKDVVRGLQMGADDYVVKPVHQQVLQARVSAVLRRMRMSPPSDQDLPLRFGEGELVIDPASRQVMIRGRTVALTPKEYDLLFFMVRRAGHILPVDLILDNVWPQNNDVNQEIVKWYVWQLRKKIEENPSEPHYILTERGVGYRFSIM